MRDTWLLQPYYIHDTFLIHRLIHRLIHTQYIMSGTSPLRRLRTQRLTRGLTRGILKLNKSIHPQYSTNTSNFSVNSKPIPPKYILNTSGLHLKYIVNTAFMYLAGSFHCFWGPVWASTSAQCVRPEAWSVGAPCGCLTSSGFCWTAPYRACWNIHALSAKKHVWCCHAMAVPTLQEPDPWAADAQNWMPW